MPGNCFVERGLGEPWFISFIVPVFPVGKDVDEDIGMEHLPVLDGHSDHMNKTLHIVTIHMPDGCFSNLPHIGTVSAGTCIQVVGCKTDLVINHKVDGAPCFITIQFRHLNYFIDHTLPCNGGISMYDNRKQFIVVSSIFVVDSCPGYSFD